MTIQTIIKRAIKRLELEGNLLTPEAYTLAFCKEANKAGMVVEDCSQVEKFTRMLNTEFQKDISQYNIKTLQELTRFIINRLNRTNVSACGAKLEAETLLMKNVLEVLSKLHNKEASSLAKKTLKLLNDGAEAIELKQYQQLWRNFASSYDDTFLQKLAEFTTLDTQDLQKTIESLNVTSTGNSDALVEKLASLCVESLTPSIAVNPDKKIERLVSKIAHNPNLIEQHSIQDEIQDAIGLRIKLDKLMLQDMAGEIDDLLDKLSLRLIDMIENSSTSTTEIRNIKNELENIQEESEVDFQRAHKKLYTLAATLEKNTEVFTKDLEQNSSNVSSMAKRIAELEAELARVKEASKEDFLTKLYNRRALDEYFNVKEAEFKRYGRNYSIAMFDLDHFKNINDTFGHDAGDAVLAAFAKILKKEAREVDVVGRFGGEEFVAILSQTDKKGAEVFANKVRATVEKTRFMYKKKRINVTVSIGVSQRTDYVNVEALQKAADDALYEAKKDGRNRVVVK